MQDSTQEGETCIVVHNMPGSLTVNINNGRPILMSLLVGEDKICQIRNGLGVQSFQMFKLDMM